MPLIGAPLSAYLVRDGWNDWWEYRTLFSLVLFDESARRIELGPVKIDFDRMEYSPDGGEVETPLPNVFQRLETEYISVGQTVEYYSEIAKLDSDLAEDLLDALQDAVRRPGCSRARWLMALCAA